MCQRVQKAQVTMYYQHVGANSHSGTRCLLVTTIQNDQHTRPKMTEGCMDCFKTRENGYKLFARVGEFVSSIIYKLL